MELLEYLDERFIIENADRFEYASVKPTESGINLNDLRQAIYSIPHNGQWELPCLSYLSVECQLVKADGSVFAKDAAGNYPNIAITNNFFPYLYSKMEYYINDTEIESLEQPGQTTTINALIKNQRAFNGLDFGWSLDTGAGQANVEGGIFMYYPVPLATIDFIPLADTTKVAYLAWLITTFRDYFTDYNKVDLEIHVTDGIVVAGAAPTRDELLTNINIVRTVCLNTRLKLNITSAVVTGDFPDGAVNVAMVIACGNALLRKFNQSLVGNRYTIVPDPNMNTGFEDRKNLLFNEKGNIMAAGDAGRFKMRIPLDHLFNFCAIYRKCIYNGMHELRLTRQKDDYAIYRHTGVPDVGKIRIDRMEWMVPRLVINNKAKSKILPTISSNIIVPMNFMCKRSKVFALDRGVTTTSISYKIPGVNTLKYIVLAFQSRDKTVYPTEQVFNYSLFNDPYNARENIIDLLRLNAQVNLNTFYISNLSNNSCDKNYAAAYYNEFKKMRQDYLNDYRNTDMISYSDFINLYRLYCINVNSKPQAEPSTGADIELQLEFTRPIPTAIAAETNVYIINYYTAEWLYNSDGSRPYTIQKPLEA